jgi:VIT1/CCC1 family predicted Fe2+/Mn2+ transporter
MPHKEQHRTQRTGWLRAAVLGANDGIVSTASLLIGVASAHATRSGILIAGIAGLVAGAMAMAAGEYVSVSSQADTERADLAIESKGLEDDRESEREELAAISAVGGVSLVSLALLGGLAAWVGGASIKVGAARVLLWGALAMGLTALVGSSFGPPT